MIQKMIEYYERKKTTLEVNNKNIHQLLYNTLDDIPIEEEKKFSLIKRIDLKFFTCRDIQTIMGLMEV
jgi:hypothetical protein